MARPETRAVATMEIFVKEDVVAPVGIGLELLDASTHSPPPAFVALEYPVQPRPEFAGDLESVHLAAGAGSEPTLNASP